MPTEFLGTEDDSEYDMRSDKIIPSIIEVSRTFNTGNYTSERISLTVEVPFDMSTDEAYKQTYAEIGRLFKKEGWR